MAVTRFKSYGEFNSHRGSGGGGFLSWKDDGEIDVWLSMVAIPLGSWRHQLPTLVNVKDKTTGRQRVRVFGKNYVCWEEEAVLKTQHFYEDKIKGIRQTPPCKCGLCKTAEWARKQALLFERTRKKEEHKGIELTTPFLKFEGDEPKETKIVTLGGFCKLLDWKDLKPSAKKAVREAGIVFAGPTGAFTQNTLARLQYGIFVLPVKDESSGVKFTVEAGSLGDKVKEKLNELFDSGIDPMKTPICMRFRYNEKEQDLNKKYSVSILRDGERLRVASPRVLKLLRAKPPEAPDDFVTPFNQKAVRMMLETHCLLAKGVVPWAKLFPTAEQEAKWAEEMEESETEDDGGESEEAQGGADADEEEEFACDECGKPVKASDEKCPHCKHEFEVDGEVAESPAPTPKKKRSEVAAKATSAKKAPAKEAEDEDEEDEEEDDEDAEEESEEDEEDDDADDEEEEEDEAPPPKKSAAKAVSKPTGNGGGSKKGVATVAGVSVNADGYPVDEDTIPFALELTRVRTERV